MPSICRQFIFLNPCMTIDTISSFIEKLIPRSRRYKEEVATIYRRTLQKRS